MQKELIIITHQLIPSDFYSVGPYNLLFTAQGFTPYMSIPQAEIQDHILLSAPFQLTQAFRPQPLESLIRGKWQGGKLQICLYSYEMVLSRHQMYIQQGWKTEQIEVRGDGTSFKFLISFIELPLNCSALQCQQVIIGFSKQVEQYDLNLDMEALLNDKKSPREVLFWVTQSMTEEILRDMRGLAKSAVKVKINQIFFKFKQNFIQQKQILSLSDHKSKASKRSNKNLPFIQLHQLGTIQYSKEQMLYILCHGYMGSSKDMYMICKHIKQTRPDSFVYCSQSNQYSTEYSIQTLGLNLASQVNKLVKRNIGFDKLKIVFVGHSLGAIIIRAALPALHPNILANLFSFISMASPHLGYLISSTVTTNIGLWYFSKQAQSMKQLSMKDNPDLRQSLLFKLSEGIGLDCFQQVVLIASHNDYYVPWHSARLQMPQSDFFSSKKDWNICEQMLQRLLSKLKNVVRIDVSFQRSENQKAVDKAIGRTAHIQFLDSQLLYKAFANLTPLLI